MTPRRGRERPEEGARRRAAIASLARRATRATRATRAGAAVVVLLVVAACEAEDRYPGTPSPPRGERALSLRTTDFQAGPRSPEPLLANPYAGNAAAVREGQRLFGWYNCAGCHGGVGGGGIGPPLRDEEWIYGGSAGHIFQSIVQGRPNGMPAYGGRVPDDQVWRIVAFIQQLGTGSGPGAGGAGPEPGQTEAVSGTGGQGEGGNGGGGSDR